MGGNRQGGGRTAEKTKRGNDDERGRRRERGTGEREREREGEGEDERQEGRCRGRGERADKTNKQGGAAIGVWGGRRGHGGKERAEVRGGDRAASVDCVAANEYGQIDRMDGWEKPASVRAQ